MILDYVRSTLKDTQGTHASTLDSFDSEKGTLILRGIEAGYGIMLEVVDADDSRHTTKQKKIRISSNINPTIGEANTASNRGSIGQGIFAAKSGVDLQFKRLVAGSNISLQSDSNTISISAMSVGESNTVSNLGSGSRIFVDKNGVDLRFRSITAGNGIVVTEVGDEIQIDTTISPGEINTGSNLGIGTAVYAGKIGTTLNFKTLVAGPNVSLTTNANNVIISSTDTGEVNTASNLGNGVNVFKQKNGVDFEFRSLSAGNNFSIVVNGNDEIVMEPVGLIGSVIEDNTPTLGGDLNVNGHAITSVSGSDIVINADGEVIINDLIYPSIDGSSGQFLMTDGAGNLSWDDPIGEPNTVSNIGGQIGLFKQKVGIDFEFKTIFANSSKIQIIDDTINDIITFDVDETQIDINDTSGVLSIANGGTGAMTPATARNNLGLGTVSTQDSNDIAITGGSLDDVDIGITTPGQAIFTDLTSNGSILLNGIQWTSTDGIANQFLMTDGNGQLSWVTINTDLIYDLSPTLGGDLDINGHVITSSSGSDIVIDPDGRLVLDGFLWPNVDGSDGQVLITDGNGELSWSTRMVDLVDDITPSLGGDLNVNGYAIVSSSGGDIVVQPDGQLILDNLIWPTSDGSDGQVLVTDGMGQLSWTYNELVYESNPTLGGDLDVNGYAIVSSSGGDILINVDNGGNLILNDTVWPATNGINGQILSINNGELVWENRLIKIEDDLIPTLGGDLDVNGYSIVSSSGGDVVIDADGNTVILSDLHVAGNVEIYRGTSRTAQYALINQTTDNTPTLLYFDGISEKFLISNNTTFMFTATVVGRRLDFPNESCSYVIRGCVDNFGPTTSMLVGGLDKTVIGEDDTDYDVNITVNSVDDTLEIEVIGDIGKTIRWVGFLEILEVIG